MAYHDELLAYAEELLRREEQELTQAHLRRAVSAAYYALFHLLISEATLHWSRDSSRPALGRMFEHGVMRRVSQRLLSASLSSFPSVDPAAVQKLRAVAEHFVNLQDARHTADYHNGVVWNRTEAVEAFAYAREAFTIWTTIRDEDFAQEFLVSLLIKSRD